MIVTKEMLTKGFIFLLMFLFIVPTIGLATTVESTTAGGWKVDWKCDDSLINHVCYVDIYNVDLLDAVTDKTDKFEASLQFSDASVSDVNAQIYEWGTEDREVTKCYIEEVTEEYCTVQDVCEKNIYDKTICNETEIISVDDWLHVKDNKFNAKVKSKNKIKDVDLKYGKFASFKITYQTPSSENSGGYGSVGKIAFIDDKTGLEYHPWWNTSWTYKRPITLLSNAPADIDDTQIHFVIDTATLIATGKMNSSCKDIRIANSAEDTELPFEIVNGTCNTTTTDIWTKADVWANNTSTIYMYYGNLVATDGQDLANTWTNFLNVYHLDEISGTTIIDSVNRNNMTVNGGTFVYSADCKFGDCAELNGTEYAIASGWLTGGDFSQGTLMAWSKTSYDYGSGNCIMFDTGGHRWALASNWDSTEQNKTSGFNFESSWKMSVSNQSDSDGAWKHIVSKYGGTEAKPTQLYINSLPQTAASNVTTMHSTNQNGAIGAYGNNPATFQKFVGILDELWVINISVSDDWITYQYGQGTDTMYTLGSEETSSTPLSITIDNPENTTYYSKWLWNNVTVNNTASVCLAQIDSTNYTMTNSTGNWNYNMTYASSGARNTTFYCNDTADNWYTNITYYTVFLTRPLSLTLDSPINTTYKQSWVWANVTSNDTTEVCWGRYWDGFGYNDITMTNDSATHWYANQTGLPEGYGLNIYARCTDGSYNTTYDSAVTYFTVNYSTPIDITVSSPTNTSYNVTTVWNNMTANITDNISLCWVNTGGVNVTLQNTSGNWNNLTTYAEGVQNSTFYCNDTGGYEYSDHTVYFTINVSLPVSITMQQPTNTTYNNTGWVWTNATLNNTADQCWAEVNGANNSLANNSGNWNANVSGLANNTGYSAQIFCNDTFGNEYNGTTEWFTIFESYLTPLSITQDSPTNTTYSTSWIWTNATVNDTADMCFVWINDTNRTLANNSGNWNHNATPFSEGYYNSTIWCNDSFGNEYFSAMEFFTVNYSTPIAITQDSPTNTTYNNTGWVWTNATLNITTGVDMCWSQVNGTGHVMINHTLSNSSGNWNHNVTPLNNNTGFTSQIFCNDTGGYEYNSTIEYFTILSTYVTPLAVTLNQPTNTTYNNTGWVWTNATINDTASYCWSEVNGANNSMANNSGNWNANVSGLSNNTGYNATVYCNDSFGNEFNSATEWFTILSTYVTPLAVTLNQPTNTTYHQTWIWVNATINNTASYCWANSDLTTNYTMANNSGNWNYNLTGLAQTGHNISVTCNDSFGNEFSSADEFYTVNLSTPLLLTVSSPTNTTYGSSFSVWNNVTVNDTADQCWVRTDGVNFSLANNSGNWNYVRVYSNGPHNSTIYCNDSTSLEYPSSTVYFTVAVFPTVVTLTQPLNITYYTNLSIMNNATTSIAVSTCVLDNGTDNNTMSNTSATDWYYNQTYTVGGHESTAFCFNGTWYASGTTYFTRQLDPGAVLYSPLNITYNTTALIWINASAIATPCVANISTALNSTLFPLTQYNATDWGYLNYFADGNYSAFVVCGASTSPNVLFEVDLASSFTTMSDRVESLGELFILYVFGNMWFAYMFFILFFILLSSRMGFGMELSVPIGLLIVMILSGVVWSTVGLIAAVIIGFILAILVHNAWKQK